MVDILTQDRNAGAGHYLVSEASGYRSREQVYLAAGAGRLRAGSVLGRIDASGEYGPYTPGATNGTQKAVAILWEARDATGAAARCVITSRDAEVHTAVLTWAEGVTDAQRKAGMASLAGLGIVGR